MFRNKHSSNADADHLLWYLPGPELDRDVAQEVCTLNHMANVHTRSSSGDHHRATLHEVAVDETTANIHKERGRERGRSRLVEKWWSEGEAERQALRLAFPDVPKTSTIAVLMF